MKRIIAIVLIFAMVCTLLSCSSTKSKKTVSTQTAKTTAQNTTTSVPRVTLPSELDENMLALLSKEITFENDDFADLEAELSNIHVTYPYEELYGVMETYERYCALPEYVSTHKNYFADGKFTADELFKIVKQNNTKAGYDKTNKKIEDVELRYACETITPILWEYAKEMSPAEASLLSEKISELKILSYNEFSSGFYDPDTGNFGLDVSKKEIVGLDRYTKTIQHETHHLLQSSSMKERDAKGIKYRIGFSCVEDEKEVQPINFYWIYECSAEILTHNRLSSREYILYQADIKLVNYIKVATILRADIDDTRFEELSLSSDFDDLFNYFDCETYEEKQELLNMASAINYMCDFQMCEDNLADLYEAKYKKEFPEKDFELAVVNAVGKSLSREFFKNFSNALKGQTMTLEDVFILNALFEHRVCDYSLFQSIDKYEEMLSLYRTLQDLMFTVIADKLEVTPKDIRNTYDVFYPKTEINANNIPFVSKSEADFLQYTTNVTPNPRVRTINQYLALIGK